MGDSHSDFYGRFGQQLRQARIAAGLSQADLAVAIGLTRTSVSNIEKGRQKVLLHTFGKILETLRAQADDLLAVYQSSADSQAMNCLAHDERAFVERGLGTLAEEEHA